ncbi:MAG TPA: FAD-dependent oxidoreductase [Bacteroidia bacterium]|jgi:glycine/D-amino acid oxidase-like deaminating enzyme/nitrite reductase/ring-hydroxylating ferredoxin subunit|nr:FAD-dependent oxidoreductase [Bacteroidia bacterium]
MDNKQLQDGNITSGKNISFWTNTINPIFYAKLTENLETDVVIVGGGIAGVTIAYCLLQSGRKVILVEDGAIGSGETGRTTAHLVNALDDRYYELEEMYGTEKIQIMAESHTAAIDLIERISKNEKIDCDFERVPGYLFLHPTDSHDSLQREYIAAKRAGVDVEELQAIPDIQEKIPCLRFNNQAQFHPLKYLRGLSKQIEKMGGLIFTETRAEKIDHKGIVTKDGFTVTAKHVVVATNTPVNNKYVMHLKQYPYRSYVVGAKVKKGKISKALWWDTGDFSVNAEIPPYHYVRLHPLDNDYDLLICGGEDHPTGVAKEKSISEEDRYGLLENWMRKKFDVEEIIYQWSGQVLEPMDSIAYIGRNPMDKDNVYIVTGDSGNGMTHGTIAGMLITDLINGRENKWEKLYAPSRFKIFTAPTTFFKEMVGGFFKYLMDKPKDVKSIEVTSIPQGEAKIVEIEKKKVGAYRDYEDQLHIVDSECTHLQCQLKWNNDEKSWDCPCHGSRFSYEGKILNGPANKDLDYHLEHNLFTSINSQQHGTDKTKKQQIH